MEPKKSPKADLESKKAFFTEIGFILTLAALLIIFGWKSYDLKEIEVQSTSTFGGDQEKTPITIQEKPTPPMVVKAPTVLHIVDNKTEVVDIGPIDLGDDANKPSPLYKMPVPKPADEVPIEDEPVIVADIQPEFPGGYLALRKFLGENLKYSKQAKEVGISGTVHVAFVVEKDGSVTNIRILRGIGGGCDEEAVRVIQMMPKWKPGWVKGKLVRTHYNLPIKFELL